MLYFSSDYHFGSEFIRSYYERPFSSADEMDEEIIKRHNSRICKDDIVIIAGDFWHGDKHSRDYYKSKLNGDFIFLQGNHEENEIVLNGLVIAAPKASNPAKDALYEKQGLLEEIAYVHGAVLDIPDVVRNEESDIYENRAYITHNPMDANLNYRINITGHVHLNRRAIKKKNSWIINVSVDKWDFYPITFKDIQKEIEKQNDIF